MAKPKYIAMDGHFVESDYENALISFLEAEGWQYIFGERIVRPNQKEVLYMDDTNKGFSPRFKAIAILSPRREVSGT